MGFDPYETWLGIPPDRRPPTHYDLLGLAPYESDPATIDQAALRRMSKVRQHQIGPHSDQSQEILSELARARLILMDPDRRTDYDAKLRARGEGRVGPSAALEKLGNGDATRDRPDDGTSDVFASLALTEQAAHDRFSLRSNLNNKPPWRKRGLVLGAVLASLAVLLGAFYCYVISPPSWEQKLRDLVRNNSDRLTPTQKPRTSVPPARKPVVTPKPAAPVIVQRRANHPGGGGERATPSFAALDGKDKDVDNPSGPGRVDST